MKKQHLALMAVVALQAAFLLAWAGYHEVVRRTAPEIVLETRPVDPRDILRGDFMILNYAISRHPGPADWPEWRTNEVCVVLRPEGRFHVIEELRREEPDATDPRPWVRARAWRHHDGNLNLSYGVEQFFVPEGMGTPRFTTMEVVASVSPARRLYIKQVRLDGVVYP